MRNGKALVPIIGIVALVIIVFTGLTITRNLGKSDKAISQESAEAQLEKMVQKVEPIVLDPVKAPVEYVSTEDDGSELPPIDPNDVVVKANTSVYAEIVSSPEKVGNGSDGWMKDLAEKFNSEGHTIDGTKISIQLRDITSGLAYDYIRTGAYVPDGFTPSNKMWISMLGAKGVKTTTVLEKTVGNTAILVMEKEKYKEFTDKYGSVDIKSIAQATEAGEFVMGYTNPFTSSTGLNFLVSTLQRYDGSNPLSDTAVSGFTEFQKNIPFVAYNTTQMRNANQKGALDGFILESQYFNNDKSMERNYEVVPFGYRHDNPLVIIEPCDDIKAQIIKEFASYCSSPEAEKLAAQYGFNTYDSYKNEFADLDGNTLIEAQKLYKEAKDSGKTVVAVFVCDASGSMDGAPMNSVKESLINSMQYISPDNYIGLVSYNSDVYIHVPLAKFDLNQQSYFKGGIQEMYPSGATATYDGVLVALDMIRNVKETVPDMKPIVFVLSDGDTNQGYGFNDIQYVVSGLKVPIYTINYNYDGSNALKSLSDINEAASINADTDDVVYQLKNLLNASM
ncbi:MAG: VWA domain-containing protein [Lachnospiraceae bacterium]|nr:VWA domain-containing protein [Lachnospiraceae bacterium]